MTFRGSIRVSYTNVSLAKALRSVDKKQKCSFVRLWNLVTRLSENSTLLPFVLPLTIVIFSIFRCIIDFKPREFTDQDRDLLISLAQLVVLVTSSLILILPSSLRCVEFSMHTSSMSPLHIGSLRLSHLFLAEGCFRFLSFTQSYKHHNVY